jgi:hypothetical protein
VYLPNFVSNYGKRVRHNRWPPNRQKLAFTIQFCEFQLVAKRFEAADFLEERCRVTLNCFDSCVCGLLANSVSFIQVLPVRLDLCRIESPPTLHITGFFRRQAVFLTPRLSFEPFVIDKFSEKFIVDFYAINNL